ncbi:DNA methylase [Bacillus sp. AFS073361]|uniref:DNA-methyltransferase n=1 Tax=Bacillus sp. AFS073361 TaxID=2033511 RepID=UPI000BF38299|nr:site-specific DNA-methyltransferase [Bacillus sp. AFS073361]PFP30203.1 DNA methylase [Bacillus sp. AFS073361]
MRKKLLGSLELNRIYQMDCLEGSKLIENESVDLILTDLPYGNMNTDGGRKLGINGWDHAIEPAKVFEIANRVLRKNGKMILFSQEPYTTELINCAIPNLPFSYRAIWEKDNFANALGVNKAMVSFYEDILIFSKNDYHEAKHPLRETMKKYLEKYGRDYIFDLFTKEGRYSKRTVAKVHASFKFGFNSGRFDFMDYKMYEFLSNYIQFEETYEQLKAIDTVYKQSYSSTFNLWEGNKFKSNILKYKKDYDGFHPTQKPVLLLEDLIKTFSNDGDIVVDLTCGSGSTCVAAARVDRNFIGFELETEYVRIANQRLEVIQDETAERKLTEE